jgi:hypothetical protein
MNVDIPGEGLFLFLAGIEPALFPAGIDPALYPRASTPRFIRGHRTDSRPYARAPTDVLGKPVGST